MIGKILRSFGIALLSAGATIAIVCEILPIGMTNKAHLFAIGGIMLIVMGSTMEEERE